MARCSRQEQMCFAEEEGGGQRAADPGKWLRREAVWAPGEEPRGCPTADRHTGQGLLSFCVSSLGLSMCSLSGFVELRPHS